jgi:hypothetical protein
MSETTEAGVAAARDVLVLENKTVTREQIQHIGHKLGSVGFSLLGLYNLAQNDTIDHSTLRVLAETIAKSGVRDLDMCLCALDFPFLGNFETLKEYPMEDPA